MEIRGSQDTLIIAVDIRKIRNCACFVSSSGKVLKRRFFFTNTIDGFNQLMGQTKSYQNREKLPNSLFGTIRVLLDTSIRASHKVGRESNNHIPFFVFDDLL